MISITYTIRGFNMILYMLMFSCCIVSILLYRIVDIPYQFFVLTFPLFLMVLICRLFKIGLIGFLIVYVPVIVLYLIILFIEHRHHDNMTRFILILSFMILCILYSHFILNVNF